MWLPTTLWSMWKDRNMSRIWHRGEESQDDPHFQACLGYLENSMPLNTPLSSPPPAHRNILLSDGRQYLIVMWLFLYFKIHLEVYCLWNIYALDFLTDDSWDRHPQLSRPGAAYEQAVCAQTWESGPVFSWLYTSQYIFLPSNPISTWFWYRQVTRANPCLFVISLTLLSPYIHTQTHTPNPFISWECSCMNVAPPTRKSYKFQQLQPQQERPL